MMTVTHPSVSREPHPLNMTNQENATLAAPKAVMLDFDGVIVDSVAMKTAVFAELFADEVERLPAILNLHLRLGGISRHEKFRLIHRDILRRPLSPERAAALGARFADLIAERMPTCPPIPGADAFLSAWARRAPLFVVSGTPEDELRRIIGERGLAPHFREVHGSPRTKPEILRDILSRHGWDPRDVAFVGDAISDAEAARDTGIPFIGVVPTGHPSPFTDPMPTIPDLTRLEATLTSPFPAPTPKPPLEDVA